MRARPTKSAGKPRPLETAPDVEELLATLDHPRLAEINALRAIIRGVDSQIHESVKWNAPSFATTEHFATFHLRDKGRVQVVLHLGATPRPDAGVRTQIDDPEQLLAWRGSDRAIVTFADSEEIAAKRAAFVAVIQQWISFVT